MTIRTPPGGPKHAGSRQPGTAPAAAKSPLTTGVAVGPGSPTRLTLTDPDRFLAAMVESADDAIFAKSLDGTILSWNNGAEQMYGYSPDEVIGRHVHMLAPLERHGEIDRILERLSRGRHVDHFETVRVRKNGARFPASLAISPVRDEAGTIIGACTVARDITEQRRLAESMAFQKLLLTAQSEASTEGIVVIDPMDRIVLSNSRLAEIWSFGQDDLAPGTLAAFVDAASHRVTDPEEFQARMEGLTAHRDDQARDQLHLRNGRVLDRYTAPVRGDDGRIYGRVWYFRDMTSETIRSAQLHAVIAAIADAAIVFDSSGRAVLQNPAARRLVPGLDAIADLVERLDLPAGPAAAADILSMPPLHLASDVEVALRTADGPRRFLISTRAVVLEPDTREPLPSGRSVDRTPLGTLVLLRDITELRDVQSSREAIIGVLSHELRTPITTIFGAGKMLERPHPDGVRSELLRDIVAESDRLYRLVEDLLVLTRIERASLELANGPIRIGPVIDRLVAAERTTNPDIHLDVQIGRHLGIVSGEETYVEQVLRNLLGNAIKYGPPSGRVRLIAEPTERGGVAVRVLDDGPGIAHNERDRVFELLYRSPATAAQAAGSGIGLFVSRRLADAMGGQLTARQRAEGGSEFVLELAPYDESEFDSPEPL